MLKKCVTLGSVVAVLLSAGCHLPGQKVGWGCEFRVYKPAVIETGGEVVVQHDSGPVTPQNIGNVSGPVQSGQWLHGQAPAVKAFAVPFAGRMDTGACLPMPMAAQPTLTCEQWCQMMKAMQTRPMPAAQE